MRVIFMGTPIWAAAYLKPIIEAGHEISLVVTQPDRPRGRKGTPQPSAVKQQALELGLDVIAPENVNDEEALAAIEAAQPDALVVVAYGQILRNRLLAMPRIAPVNVHYSLLPKLRGAAPVQFALLEGLERTGVTLQYMARKVDAGDVLVQAELAINPDDNTDTLGRRLTELGTHIIGQALSDLEAGLITPQPQDEAAATFTRLLTKEDQVLDFTESAVVLQNRIRALSPKPGAYCLLNGKRLIIKAAAATENLTNGEGKSGTIVEMDSSVGPYVQTGSGLLVVQRVQPEGRREMSAADWLRGANVAIGSDLSVQR